MHIDLNVALLEADGMTDDEIASIRRYMEAVDQLDNLATAVRLSGEIRLVCRTVALAIKAVRPEAYLGTIEEIFPGWERHLREQGDHGESA